MVLVMQCLDLVKKTNYLTGECVVNPPYFFANQFGDWVACVIWESLHKVLSAKVKEKEHGDKMINEGNRR